MRSQRLRTEWFCVVPTIAAVWSVPAAANETLPTQFAGEALTVALAFCLPALLAGAYLAVQRLNARLGARTVVALVLTMVVIGVAAAFVEDKAGILQRAGLAGLAER